MSKILRSNPVNTPLALLRDNKKTYVIHILYTSMLYNVKHTNIYVPYYNQLYGTLNGKTCTKNIFELVDRGNH